MARRRRVCSGPYRIPRWGCNSRWAMTSTHLHVRGFVFEYFGGCCNAFDPLTKFGNRERAIGACSVSLSMHRAEEVRLSRHIAGTDPARPNRSGQFRYCPSWIFRTARETALRNMRTVRGGTCINGKPCNRFGFKDADGKIQCACFEKVGCCEVNQGCSLQRRACVAQREIDRISPARQR